MLKRLFVAGLTFYLLGVSARAQTSVYSSMTAAGEWQGWNPGANNLYLISNQVWEGVFFISQRPANEFKFVANGNWGTDWGVSVSGSVPLSGTATPGGPNIALTNVVEGFYRFRFRDSDKVFWVDYLSPAYVGASGTNLIRNGDFTLPDGVNSNEAYNWNYRPSMTYGDNYGNSGRVDWRGRSVPWQFFVGPTFGGIWQDVPAGNDFDYETTAWFWMDGSSNTNFGPWTAELQEFKIEFYSATRGAPIAVVSTNIPFIPEDWFPVTLRAAAPTNAAWARTVINVSGAGQKGTLQIDDIAMRLLPRSFQTFATWNFTTTGTLARGGWVASNAFLKAIPPGDTNELLYPLVYTSPSLAIRPGGSISSPRIEEGISRLQFYYRTSFEGVDDPTDNLTAIVEFSPDGVSFAELPGTALNGITVQSYFQRAINVNDPAQKYFRIRVTSGTNQFMIDNIEVVPINVDSRYQDFSTWTNSSLTNLGCHTVGSWSLCASGRVFSSGAFQAPSALLPGRTSNHNYVQSPLLTNGYGTISFQLARGNNGAAPGRLNLQESANGTTWTNIAVITNLNDTSWSPFSFYFFQGLPRYIRLVNTSEGITNSSGSTLLINEGFSTYVEPASYVVPEGWTFNSISNYTSSGNFGLESPSIRFDATGDSAETPALGSPTNVQFWMKGQSINVASEFRIEAFVSAAWQTVTTLTGIANSGTTYSVPVTTNATRLRFLYANKVGGNISFDDVVIRGAPSGAQPPQDLLIDNIDLALPEEVRTQNFNSWPPKLQYASGLHMLQGWYITNAIVDGQNAYEGQVLRLNTGLDNYIRTVSFPEGIGQITFQYAKWASSDTSPTLAVQYSTNDGSAWTTITNLLVANAASNGYIRFAHLLNTTVPTAFRILHTAGAGRTLIDDIDLGKPQPPADVTLSGFHVPESPFTNDTVSLRAVVSPAYGASVTNLTAFYRVGTAGVFTALSMMLTNYTSYESITNLGPHMTGTVVQYYFRAQFTGPGAVSPKFYPSGGSTNPTFYAIPRSKQGQVWINEVRYDGSFIFDYQDDFIELAGPTGFNISGWRVEFVGATASNLGVVIDRYVVPNSTYLPPDTPYLGFWVLGMTQGVPNVDMPLTNYIGRLLPIGVRLLNEGGGIEQALCFYGNMFGFNRVGPEDDGFEDSYSVYLTANGTNYAEYLWTNSNDRTPGAMNNGQSFGPQDTSEPPNAWISRMIWSTNVQVVTGGNTNNWIISPWYATAMTNNVSWSPLTPFTVQTNGGGTNTVSFDRPPQTNWFLRLRFSRP